MWLRVGTGNFKDCVYRYPNNLFLEFGSEFSIFGLRIIVIPIRSIIRNLRGVTDSFV
jgi:hypothetical protein